MNRSLNLKMIFSATQKAAGPMKAVQESAKAMGGELRTAKDELSKLEKAQANIDGFRRMKREMGQTEQAMETARQETRQLAAAIEATDSPTREMQRNFAKAKKESAQLGDRFDSQQRRLEELRRELKASGISTSNLSDDQRKLKRDMEAASGAVSDQESRLRELDNRKRQMAAGRSKMEATQQVGDQMMGGGARAVGVGVAIGAPLIASANEAMDLQAQLVDVRKVLDDITPAGMKQLENGLLELSGRIPVPVEGLGMIAAEAARAGIGADDLLPFTENAGKMSAAFDISADDAGKMMAQWRKGLDMTIPETVELGDKVNALTNSYGGSAPAVAEMVTLVGPLGKVAGVAAGEMAGMAQLMNSLGIESRVGSTGIKNFMLTLSAGEGASKKQSAAFASLGLDAVAMSKMMQEDARGGILSVLDAISQLPKEQQAGLLTNLFGRESVAAIAPLLSNLDALKGNFELVGDAQSYAGSMNREFDVAMSKSKNKVDLATNGIKSMAGSFGAQLLPMIDAGAAKIQTITTAVGSWARENPGVTKGIVVTAAALAVLLVGVGSLAIGIGAILGPFAALKFALTFAGPMLKGSMAVKVLGGAFGFLKTMLMVVGKAFLANPIVLVVAAIAAAAYLIYSNWDKIAPYFQAVWAKVKAIFAPIITVLKAVLFTFTPAGLIYKHWDTITAFFGDVWDGVSDFFKAGIRLTTGFLLNFTPAGLIYKHWDGISEFFRQTMAPVAEVFSAIWGGIAGFFSGMWEEVKSVFSGAWSVIQSAAEGNFNPGNIVISKWSKLTRWFSGLWDRVGTTFSSKWLSIRGMMTGWYQSMTGIGSRMIDNLISGIKSAPGAVLKALKGLVSGAMNAAADLLGFGGPSAAPDLPPNSAAKKLAGARAAGGPVSAGKMYLVGEEGPEFFIPGPSGTILSNPQSARLARAKAGIAAGMALSLSAPLAAQEGIAPRAPESVSQPSIAQSAPSAQPLAVGQTVPAPMSAPPFVQERADRRSPEPNARRLIAPPSASARKLAMALSVFAPPSAVPAAQEPIDPRSPEPVSQPSIALPKSSVQILATLREAAEPLSQGRTYPVAAGRREAPVPGRSETILSALQNSPIAHFMTGANAAVKSTMAAGQALILPAYPAAQDGTDGQPAEFYGERADVPAGVSQRPSQARAFPDFPAFPSAPRPQVAIRGSGGGDSYTIAVTVKGGGDSRRTGQDVADAVRTEIQRIEREKEADRRSLYLDEDDG